MKRTKKKKKTKTKKKKPERWLIRKRHKFENK